MSVTIPCIFTFWVMWCGVRYNFSSYLPPVVCRRAHVLFISSCM